MVAFCINATYLSKFANWSWQYFYPSCCGLLFFDCLLAFSGSSTVAAAMLNFFQMTFHFFLTLSHSSSTLLKNFQVYVWDSEYIYVSAYFCRFVLLLFFLTPRIHTSMYGKKCNIVQSHLVSCMLWFPIFRWYCFCCPCTCSKGVQIFFLLNLWCTGSVFESNAVYEQRVPLCLTMSLLLYSSFVVVVAVIALLHSMFIFLARRSFLPAVRVRGIDSRGVWLQISEGEPPLSPVVVIFHRTEHLYVFL